VTPCHLFFLTWWVMLWPIYILNKAKQKGHIKGLVPHLVDGGLTQLQYADDTILFMDYDDKTIMNFKFF
jgi:hypothetical protein